MSEREFTYDWATRYKRALRTLLKGKADTPMNYLEIGVFEGRSMCIMLNHYLKHKDSRAWGIDPWNDDMDKFPQNKRNNEDMADIKARALRNLAEYKDKVTLIEARSQDYLTGEAFPNAFFDVIYVDGSHDYQSCLQDSSLVWPLLKQEGICVWDDYRNKSVKRATSEFLGTITGYEVRHENRHLIVEKR